MNRRLALAYAWGKWLAININEYEQTRKQAQRYREGGNWAILVSDDDFALHYQRLEFRLRRAMRAVGAWGLCGYSQLTSEGLYVAAPDKVASMNFDQFHKSYRERAMRAKQLVSDKRHPRHVLEDLINTAAWEEEKTSMAAQYI